METAEVDLIIPVYNEGPNIARVLEEIAANVPLSKRALLVYDRDDDDTLPVVRTLTDRFPWVETRKNTIGAGVLNAMKSGIAAATADVVVITMADLSDDVSIVPRMVDLIRSQGFDLVFASRYMTGGKQIGGPWLKGRLSRLAGLSLHALARWPTHDATNAFRAYRRSVLQGIAIESQGGFAVSLELAAKALAQGARATEIPSTWTDRSVGASRFQLRKWLPSYLRWYLHALTHRPRRSDD